uniref:ATP synthase mitochondrial F1 complex assembly factor 2 n=1 Tax=Neobodo designis TaxID=312471 RepID=A0A7S1MI27_NEODS|mmetsp:Transcript_41076/g.126818  ORF Transcript_41076/g.126818 Transcript_41076/m.126818 type:complete len:381 (+) Transcript_41076:42-1184(+)|eukprot:CAMPEP_0174838622 /NCGR_PEP_ID=MMETSP1114-20130205/7507_1 /TAXON_ID=312471 /ORGANISM="Neobodo designis, Strain CCAP 1951/1" /LENGTH=380 /DNA_ID=CAMNT_0016072725 /DNA_START=41 /DNA_END=1183 /DNA_ORIENTATION=+
MQRLARATLATAAAGAMTSSSALRFCASSPAGGVGAAPKKQRAGFRASVASARPTNVPDAGRGMQPKAEAEFSTDEIARRLEELDSMDPQDLQRMRSDFEAKETAETRVLNEDNLYQLDVSTSTRQQGALRVFWKNVDIVAADGAGENGWYKVTLDGRKVKAFENANQLILPNREYALAVAHEFGAQTGHLNKLVMPLTDLASGAMLVSAQGIPARIDYLMSFFMTDNCYFRSEAIAAKQDALIAPVVEWYDRVFDLQSPRIMGIGHPNLPQETALKVREQLLAMNLNQHQVVALCVVAQFTASLMLPLAMFHNVISVEHGLRIHKAEEAHNTGEHGEIKGYHDIRDADTVVKIAAATAAWQMTAGLPSERYAVLSTLVQ